MDSLTDIAEHFRWQDRRQIFNTKTSHFHNLMVEELSEHHSSITKWQQQIWWMENPMRLWSRIWVPHWSLKENAFLWQVSSRIIATNGWHYPKEPKNDVGTWCVYMLQNSDLERRPPLFMGMWLRNFALEVNHLTATICHPWTTPKCHVDSGLGIVRCTFNFSLVLTKKCGILYKELLYRWYGRCIAPS